MKKRFAGRVSGIAMALAMLLALIPVNAFADTPSGGVPEWPEQGAIRQSKTAKPLESTGYDPETTFQVTLRVEGKDVAGDVAASSPQDVYLLLDNSSVMRDRGIGPLRETALALADILLPDEAAQARVWFLTFSTTVGEFEGPYTFSSKDELKAALANVKATGGDTNIQQALQRAKTAIAQEPERKSTVVLLSGGVPTVSYKGMALTAEGEETGFVRTPLVAAHERRITRFGSTRITQGSSYDNYYYHDSMSDRKDDRYTIDGYMVIDHGLPTISEAHGLKQMAEVYTVDLGEGEENHGYVLRNCASDEAHALGADADLATVFGGGSGDAVPAATSAVVTDPLGRYTFPGGEEALMFEPILDDENNPVLVNGEVVDLSAADVPVRYDEEQAAFVWAVGALREGSPVTLSYTCVATQEGLALHKGSLPDSLANRYPLGGNTVMDYTTPTGGVAQLAFDMPRASLPGLPTTEVTVVYFQGPLPEGLSVESYDPADPPRGQIGTYTLRGVEQGQQLAELDIPLDADGSILGAPTVLDGLPARGYSRTGVIDEEKSLSTVGADAGANLVFAAFPDDPAAYVTLAWNLDGMENAPAAPQTQTLFAGTALQDAPNGMQGLPAKFVAGKTAATDDNGVTWTFEGWYARPQGEGERFAADTVVTAGMADEGVYTLHAKWSAGFTVRYRVDPVGKPPLTLNGGQADVTYAVRQVWGMPAKTVDAVGAVPDVKASMPYYLNFWQEDESGAKMAGYGEDAGTATWDIAVGHDITFTAYGATYGEVTFTFETADAATGKLRDAAGALKSGVTQTEYRTAAFTAAPVPEPAPGYRFAGWQEGSRASDGWPESYDKNRTFRALFEKEDDAWITLAFNANGGRWTDGKTAPGLQLMLLEEEGRADATSLERFAAYVAGQKEEWPEWAQAQGALELAAAPMLEGYGESTGWFPGTGAEDTTAFDETTRLCESGEVFARYQRSATIRFTTDGGALSKDTPHSAMGTVTWFSPEYRQLPPFPAVPAPLESDRSKFSHWSLEGREGEVFFPESFATDATYVVHFSARYQLGYLPGAASGTVVGMPQSRFLEAGEAYRLDNAPASDRDAFTGWALAGGSPTPSGEEGFTMPAEDVTYEACWTDKAIRATVDYTYLANGVQESHINGVVASVGLQNPYDVSRGLARPGDDGKEYDLQSITVQWRQLPVLHIYVVGESAGNSFEDARFFRNIRLAPYETLDNRMPGILEQVTAQFADDTFTPTLSPLGWFTLGDGETCLPFDPAVSTITADTTVFISLTEPPEGRVSGTAA